LDGNTRQLAQQREADSLSAIFRQREQVFQVQSLPCKEGRVVVEEECEARRLGVDAGGDDLGLGTLTEECAGQGGSGGGTFACELVVPGEPSDEAQDECFITWLGVSQMYRWLHAGLFTAEAQRAPRFFLSPQSCTWNRRAVLGDGMPRGGIALPCYAAASWHLEWPALRRLRMPRGNCFPELLQCRCRVCIVMMPLCFSVASVVNRELPASFAPLR